MCVCVCVCVNCPYKESARSVGMLSLNLVAQLNHMTSFMLSKNKSGLIIWPSQLSLYTICC